MIEEATGLGPPGQALPEDPGPAGEALNEIFSSSREILPGRGDRLIEVTWEQPVAYAVTDESFSGPERDNLSANGRAVRIVEDSWFDDFVKASTWASDGHPGPLRHYRIVTLNHTVNVISCFNPIVRLVHVHQ